MCTLLKRNSIELVAEVKGVHLSRVILLLSQEGLDDDDLRKEFDGSLVVTMHTNDFNTRISKSRRICAAIRDNTDFDELKLQEHLDKLCRDINQQHSPTVADWFNRARNH